MVGVPFRGHSGVYDTLPKCAYLSHAWPAKSSVILEDADPHAGRSRNGQDFAFMDLRCQADYTEVDVSLWQQGDMDLMTGKQYPDKAVHDGVWRANDMFVKQAEHFESLGADVHYGSADHSGDACTVVKLKQNAIVTLTMPNPVKSPKTAEEFKAGCRQIAQTRMSKIVDAVLG